MSSPAGVTLVPPRLRVRTVVVPDPGPLVALLPETDALAWIRGGDGMVAWGEVVRHKAASPADAEEWWTTLVASCDEETELDGAVPGSGLVAFGSFVFDPDNTSASSGLVVPRTVLGRRNGRAWLTEIGVEADEQRPVPCATPVPPAPEGVRFEGGSLTSEQWRAAVSRAVGSITAGQLDKVVLARDLVARADADLDPRWLVGRLSETYPRCWTYLVDGIVGATPEMLVRLEAGLATSRVLAGTIQRTGDGRTDLARADALTRSSKDLEEHEYAVASVAAALEPFCSALNVPETPYVLELPNVLHLASDVTAAVAPGVTSLSLAAALHPSAAVCGTPTDVARGLIAELEHLDRARYAGPVGWTDASGAGEWAIALRCGILDETDPRTIRLFAGCGIVAGSDPDAEWAEAQAKLAPMIGALTTRR
ncbi:isochorismate synthase [Microlunatus flavus]|uniref:isochorismate synthase n=1 Tax=Microlunatus flavus TaxID=1036181 RepID=A0A1H9LXJ3_9ACTN|nr:isochorismate synthase [Microlunatus flavus]SER16078.1 menaquinone-specific isochorismate synthase [Microlunatus flavus]